MEDQAEFTHALEQLLSTLGFDDLKETDATSRLPRDAQEDTEINAAQCERDSDAAHEAETSKEPEHAISEVSRADIEQSVECVEEKQADAPVVVADPATTTDAVSGRIARSASAIGSRDDTYRVFTARFDEIVDADALCQPAELSDLWQQLQIELAPHERLIGKLASRLERKLRPSATRQWSTIRRKVFSTPHALLA